MKLLGSVDLFAAFLLVAIGLGVIAPKGLIILAAFFLFLKSLICLRDIGSMMDIAFAILLVLSIFLTTIPPVILFVAAILLGVKGLMSLF